MVLRRSLEEAKFAPLLAPTSSPSTSSNGEKTKFYEDLHALRVTLPKAETLVVLHDFTVHARRDCVNRGECWAAITMALFFCELVQKIAYS
ncbi:unnamed protein product [Schistocephalus solidus]|uniref:Uncharacterized protein n=1 Tax=Schistocephalus solidus TaxID=70667 RepID=A0A183S9U3_SCHSO|nr:unnamed protein product [Schistocephalus solidus]